MLLALHKKQKNLPEYVSDERSSSSQTVYPPQIPATKTAAGVPRSMQSVSSDMSAYNFPSRIFFLKKVYAAKSFYICAKENRVVRTYRTPGCNMPCPRLGASAATSCVSKQIAPYWHGNRPSFSVSAPLKKLAV